MVTESAPAVIEHRALVGKLILLREKYIVDPPSIAEILKLEVVEILLPVEPPEVNAFFFHGCEHIAENALHESLVGAIPRNLFLFGGVETHVGSNLGISDLEGHDTRGGVEVEGDLEVFRLQIVEEFIGLREERLVPAETGPSTAFTVDVVPVHIHHEHIERDIVGLHLVDKVAELLIAVGPVAAPPISESVARGQRHFAGEYREVGECLAVVLTVGHEIPVLRTVGRVALLYPIPVFGAVE